MKVLAILAVAALLAACDIGATTPSEASLPSIGESSTAASASTAATMEESPTAMSCSDAFADVDAATVIALGNLAAVTDELDSTLAACSSADEWESAAESALAGLDISDPQGFIAARCANVSTLAGAAICSEIGS